jgi:hypothetical protein
MHKDTKRWEEEKIRDLDREYSAKGYRVVLEPGTSKLPKFMQSFDYHPDLIVYGKNESLVIEVTSSSTISDAKRFSHIADSVRNQKGWDFVLVMTNPRSKSNIEPSGEIPGSQHALQQLTEAEQVLSAGTEGQFVNAAFLVAWAGLEAAIRYSLSRLYKRDKSVSQPTLVRDAGMYGVISRQDSEFIEIAMRARNSIAHGYQDVTISKGDIRRIIEIGRRVLAETHDQLSTQQITPADG